MCSTEKNLLEHKDKIPEEVRADVLKAIDDVKAVQESEDAEDIKAKVQALQVRDQVHQESPTRPVPRQALAVDGGREGGKGFMGLFVFSSNLFFFLRRLFSLLCSPCDFAMLDIVP